MSPRLIAAALARPGEPAVSISGDGTFLMNYVELETAVRLKLPTVHLSGGTLAVGFQDQASQIA
jgi:acetolactate synthase-1/2/3 large subunit